MLPKYLYFMKLANTSENELLSNLPHFWNAETNFIAK